MSPTDHAALDAQVAERLFGMVPCDGWVYFNLGSAGGPAYERKCDHERDKCWNTKVEPRGGLLSVFNAFGGLPTYSSTPGGERAVRDALLARGYLVDVYVCADGTGEVTLYGATDNATTAAFTDANTPRAMSEAALAALEAE